MDFICEDGSSSVQYRQYSIQDLPDEILEYILGLLRPYSDLQNCMLVSKKWRNRAQCVLSHKINYFNRCLTNFNIVWEHYTPVEIGLTISKRYSHSACTTDNSMYVFGGCTCTSTTFNDLWRLDLSTRHWCRMLTMGTYPTPKALATLIHYKGLLVLFGGWTHPTPFPLHQGWRTFNELHICNIKENRWSCVVTPELSPPHMAGHSATVQGEEMVVFGGITGQFVTGSSNDIWCYNFLSETWRRQETNEPKPLARYNHSQISIDDSHLLILGGCGGRPGNMLNDAWLLTLMGDRWTWTELTVENPEWASTHPSNGQSWCHPTCKSGTNVVAVAKSPNAPRVTLTVPRWTYLQQPQNADNFRIPRRMSDGYMSPPIDRDVNVNGRRGILIQRHNVVNAEPPAPLIGPRIVQGGDRYQNDHFAPSYNMAAFRTAGMYHNNKYRERQLEVLHRMEERLRHRTPKPHLTRQKERAAPTRQTPSRMAMFVMDIANAVTEHRVVWLPIKNIPNGGPEHTMLFSLVAGQGEIIMFGGIEKEVPLFNIDESTNSANVINTVHFITAPREIV